MPDTVRTKSALLTTLFQDGQAAGSITPQDLRDLIVSLYEHSTEGIASRTTPAQVQASIDALIASAPDALNTLDELAAALGDDANFASTITTALAGKAPTSHGHEIGDINTLTAALAAKASLASPALTGTPTAPTATAGTNTTQVATTAFVTTAVAAGGGGGGIAPTLFDAKGELIGASAADTPERVPAADRDGKFLRAMATATAGIGYDDPFGGFRAAQWQQSAANSTASGTLTLTAGTLYAQWLPWPPGLAMQSLRINVTTAGAAASLLRLYVWENTDALYPGALIGDPGTVAADTTGLKVLSVTCTPSRFGCFLGFISDGAPVVSGVATAAMYPHLGTPDGQTNRINYGFRRASHGLTTAANPFPAYDNEAAVVTSNTVTLAPAYLGARRAA